MTLVVIAAALLAACSGSGQSGSAFVFLSVDNFSLDGTTAIASVQSSLDDLNTSTVGCVTMRNNLKNPTVTTPTTLDNVVINSYTVTLTALDGSPLPGSPFTFSTAVTVPAGSLGSESTAVSGNTATFAVILVPAQVKRDPALRSMRLPLNATAEVTFKGRDGRGQGVDTEGAIGVLIVREGDDDVATCAGATTDGNGTVEEQRRR